MVNGDGTNNRLTSARPLRWPAAAAQAAGGGRRGVPVRASGCGPSAVRTGTLQLQQHSGCPGPAQTRSATEHAQLDSGPGLSPPPWTVDQKGSREQGGREEMGEGRIPVLLPKGDGLIHPQDTAPASAIVGFGEGAAVGSV